MFDIHDVYVRVRSWLYLIFRRWVVVRFFSYERYSASNGWTSENNELEAVVACFKVLRETTKKHQSRE